jgi:VWFA-related protein
VNKGRHRLTCGALALVLCGALAAEGLGLRRAQAQTPAPQEPPAQTPTPQTQTPTPPDEDVEHVETNLVNILFNAVDKERRFVTTLKPEDVRVYEDEVPQQAATFERQTDLPLSLAILVDVSLSQLHTLPDEKAAAHIFVQQIVRPDRDRVAVLSFARDATIEQDLTDNLRHLLHAIDVLQIAPAFDEPPEENDVAGGVPVAVPPTPTPTPTSSPGAGYDRRPATSTALWDTIWATAGDLLSQTPERTRRAIILLSDGADSSSQLKRDDAVEAAVKANTVVYSIGIGDEDFDKGALRKIAERTGGRAFFPEDETELRAAFAQIQQELRTQYLISYAPTNQAHDGSFRTVRLDVVNPELRKQKLQLTYRRGYYANPPAPPKVAAPRARGQRLSRPPRPATRRKH